MEDQKIMFRIISLGICLSFLNADVDLNNLENCQKAYKDLESTYYADQQASRVEIYDYIESNMDRDRDLKKIEDCLKLKGADAMRKCIKPILKEYLH